LSANWTLAGGSTPSTFSKSRAGMVELALTLSRSGTPTVGETVLTLPPGYAPAQEKALHAISWNAGFTIATVGAVTVKPTGAVLWYAGSPTTQLNISGAFMADGLAF
jgi:hypothetical protein